MVDKFHQIDPIFKHCRMGTIPNGDHLIDVLSLTVMVRFLVASSGYTPKDAAGYIARVFLQPPNVITEATEFVIMDDLAIHYPEGLPG